MLRQLASVRIMGDIWPVSVNSSIELICCSPYIKEVVFQTFNCVDNTSIRCFASLNARRPTILWICNSSLLVHKVSNACSVNVCHWGWDSCWFLYGPVFSPDNSVFDVTWTPVCNHRWMRENTFQQRKWFNHSGVLMVKNFGYLSEFMVISDDQWDSIRWFVLSREKKFVPRLVGYLWCCFLQQCHWISPFLEKLDVIFGVCPVFVHSGANAPNADELWFGDRPDQMRVMIWCLRKVLVRSSRLGKQFSLNMTLRRNRYSDVQKIDRWRWIGIWKLDVGWHGFAMRELITKRKEIFQRLLIPFPDEENIINKP